MRRSSVIQVALLVVLAGGCSLAADLSPSASASAAAPRQSASATAGTSGQDRVPLPSGFPFLPGAVPVAMPDGDPGVIGLWVSDRPGAAAYDFYSAALPAAGYPIVGLYPGGAVAAIRFRLPSGAIWQMVVHAGDNGAATIEIRLDRP